MPLPGGRRWREPAALARLVRAFFTLVREFLFFSFLSFTLKKRGNPGGILAKLRYNPRITGVLHLHKQVLPSNAEHQKKGIGRPDPLIVEACVMSDRRQELVRLLSLSTPLHVLTITCVIASLPFPLFRLVTLRNISPKADRKCLLLLSNTFPDKGDEKIILLLSLRFRSLLSGNFRSVVINQDFLCCPTLFARSAIPKIRVSKSSLNFSSDRRRSITI